MTKRKLAVIIGGMLVVAGLGGWAILGGRHGQEYRTAAIERGEIDATVAATGTCNAVVTVQVGSQVSGNIKALYADFNTKVSKGQLVALKLFPGMTANVRILTNTAKDTLKVFGGRLTAQPRIALMK